MLVVCHLNLSSADSPAGSDDYSLMVLIAIISVGCVTTLGIILVLGIGCVLYKKKAKKGGASNALSAAEQSQDSDLIDNDSYNAVHVRVPVVPRRPQTDDDASKPAVEHEYLSITNFGRARRQNSDNTSTFSPAASESEPEYLSITNTGSSRQHTSTASNSLLPRGNSAAVIQEDGPEYVSITSLLPAQQRKLSFPEHVSMAANPSYIRRSEGLEMATNGAYWTNRDVAVDAVRKIIPQSSTSHVEATNEDSDDYTYY